MIRAGSGDDVIDGGGGRDTIYGQNGADRITGGKGADKMRGGGQGDVITGGDAGDLLRGGLGDDELRGGAGADDVDGGPGFNVCQVDVADDAARCRYELEPPEIVDVQMTPDEVDVTLAPALVTFRVHVTDDIGVHDTDILLVSGAGLNLPSDGFRLLEGSVRDGWWEGTVAVPRYTPAAVMSAMPIVNDKLGRQAQTAYGAYTLTVRNDDPDVQSPTVELLEMSPSAIDVRTQSRPVKVTTRIVDTKAGLRDHWFCLDLPGTPSAKIPFPQWSAVACSQTTTLVSGTEHDGVWSGVVNVPAGSEGGTYNLDVYALDNAGNSGRWYGPDAYQGYLDGGWSGSNVHAFPGDGGRLAVTGVAPDATSAWVSEVEVSKNHLDTLAGDDTLHVRVRAQDASGQGEGVTGVGAFVTGEVAWPVSVAGYFAKTSGTVSDGWWESDLTLPQGVPPGVYHLSISVFDRRHTRGYTDVSWAETSGLEPLESIPPITVVVSGS